MIREPQRSYLIELLEALGSVADGFVLAGAQAMKFHVGNARATRDFDFVLDAVSLRGQPSIIAAKLAELGYTAVPVARNFQFQKSIPNSHEVMRIEFMAPEEYQRGDDFRVDIQEGIHGRACTGGKIVIVESDPYELIGHLPDGKALTISLRVARPHALVMLKCLAMDDRYRNQRGPEHAGHDRDEARIHATDIVSILASQPHMGKFRENFERQFTLQPDIRLRVRSIVKEYFASETAPGLLLYEESLIANVPAGEVQQRRQLSDKLHDARELLNDL